MPDDISAWLASPAKPKTVAAILAVIAVAVSGPLLLAWAVAGNTAWVVPLWLGTLFWGCCLATVLAAWRWRHLLALPALCLLAVAGMGLVGGIAWPAYWPSRLLVSDVGGLAALHLAWWTVAAWAAYRLPPGARARLRIPLPFASGEHRWWQQAWDCIQLAAGIAGIALLLFYAVNHAIRNVAYVVASKPQTIEARVTGMGTYRHGRRTIRKAVRYWRLDIPGRSRPWLLRGDDTTSREVDTLPLELRAPRARVGCRSARHTRVGDTLVLRGRRGWAGFAVDQVLAVRRDGVEVCSALPAAPV